MESVIATREEIKRFLSIIQFDSGDGAGSGYGKGRGFGYGYGSGSGFGSGYGYGAGDGDGDGDGCGDGDGSGYGSDDGSGYGYGADDGDIKALNGNIVDNVDSLPTIIIQVRDNFAKGYTVKNDLTLSPCYIAKVGNSFAHGSTLKEAVADAGAKEMEKMPIEERIEKFMETFGALDSEHTGREFYDWHHILTGSCRMGRDAFCKDNFINLTEKYTVKYFLDITKNAYGNDIIKELRKEYKLSVI